MNTTPTLSAVAIPARQPATLGLPTAVTFGPTPADRRRELAHIAWMTAAATLAGLAVGVGSWAVTGRVVEAAVHGLCVVATSYVIAAVVAVGWDTLTPRTSPDGPS